MDECHEPAHRESEQSKCNGSNHEKGDWRRFRCLCPLIHPDEIAMIRRKNNTAFWPSISNCEVFINLPTAVPSNCVTPREFRPDQCFNVIVATRWASSFHASDRSGCFVPKRLHQNIPGLICPTRQVVVASPPNSSILCLVQFQ